MIVPSEENVILRVLSPGQHHVEGVQDVVLGGVTDNVGVALDHSQYEGGNWEVVVRNISVSQLIKYKTSTSPSRSTRVSSPARKTVFNGLF